MDSKLSTELWQRLTNNGRLDDLGLPLTQDGRLDLRGLATPASSVVRRIPSSVAAAREVSGVIELRNVRWRALDFTRCDLKNLRLFDSSLEGCTFSSANCSKWRMWNTTIRDTYFTGADLRDAVLGGVVNGQSNRFHQVDFSKADLRGTVHGSAEMVGCLFSHAKLKKVSFEGNRFERCKFEGLLEEVEFHHRSPHGGDLADMPANEMRDVDFTRAAFHYVAFHGLDLSTVALPNDDDHLWLPNYREVLARVLTGLEARTDTSSKMLAAVLGHAQKWLGAGQQQGVFSKRDLLDCGGDDALSTFLQLAGFSSWPTSQRPAATASVAIH